MEKFLTYGKFTTPHIKTQNHLKYYIPTPTTPPYYIIAGIQLGRGLVGWVVVGF